MLVGGGQSLLASQQQQQQQLIIPAVTTAAGQSLLASPVKLFSSPVKLLPPSSPMKTVAIAVAGTAAGSSKLPPRKTGSVGLFFRKFYHIAYLRLENLCSSMQVQ